MRQSLSAHHGGKAAKSTLGWRLWGEAAGDTLVGERHSSLKAAHNEAGDRSSLSATDVVFISS